jgi:hypothetical protein
LSQYTKATNFATKDTLPTGDSGKIVKGTEIDSEFNAIASAVSSKADTASPTFTGTPLAPTAASGANTTQLATTAFVTGAVSDNNTTERAATATLTNKTLTSPTINTPTISGGSITGITDLAVADGGTGASSITANSVVLGNGSSALSGNLVAPGTSGNVLTSNGTTWASSAPSVALSSFTGANQSLTANGFQKLPGGAIIQWGTVSLPNYTQATVTLPTAFTTTNYAVTFAPELASGQDPSQIFYIRSKTASSFVAENYDHVGTVLINWIAIGY